LDAGVHGLRLNPGNIGSRDRVERVVKAAQEKGISIRIGVKVLATSILAPVAVTSLSLDDAANIVLPATSSTNCA